MANREKGEVSLQVGETSYTLKQSFNAMIEAEDASEAIFGRRLTWDEIGDGVTRGDLRSLRLFLWSSLRKHHPEVTIEQAGTLVDDAGGLETLGKSFADAAKAASPDQADLTALGEAKNGRPRKARVGGIGARVTSLHAASS